MKNLTIDATIKNMDPVLDFVNRELEAINCPIADSISIAIAVEELFVNITHYAYNPEVGQAQIICEVEDDPTTVIITLLDGGKPYNPLQRDDPDITLSAEQRDMGGLGIFMVKQSMDNVNYEYKDGKNIITIRKECGK